MMKKIKIIISYEKGATINRIFAYANVFSHYLDTEVVILATEANDQHRHMLNRNITLTYVFWDGIVPRNFIARFFKEFIQVRRLSKNLDATEISVLCLLRVTIIRAFVLSFGKFVKFDKSCPT